VSSINPIGFLLPTVNFIAGVSAFFLAPHIRTKLGSSAALSIMVHLSDNLLLQLLNPCSTPEDKYLCIYVESSAPNQEIISLLRNAIV
jgi:hypothetical protein